MTSDSEAQSIGAWSRLKRHFTEAFSGELIAPERRATAHSQSEWLESRSRNAYRYILVVVAAVVLTLCGFNIYKAEWLLAAGTSLLLVSLLINIALLSTRGRSASAPLPVLVFSIVLVILGYYRGHDHSLYLLFPLIVLAPVLLRLRWAILLSLTSVAAALPHICELYAPTAAFILALSLCLTCLVATWMMFALREQARRLKGMAITDPLTKTYNRRYLELQAERALVSWERYKHPVSLLLIDIDYFKRVNDKFGHGVGDRALLEVVSRVNERVRKSDVLCRFGGEEFMLLLDEAPIGKAVQIAEELRYAIQISNTLPSGNLTVSVGVCDIAQAEDVEHWFKLADNALYLAKRNGRNRVEIAQKEKQKVVSITKSLPI